MFLSRTSTRARAQITRMLTSVAPAQNSTNFGSKSWTISTSAMSRKSMTGSVTLKVSLSAALQNSFGKKPSLPRTPPATITRNTGSVASRLKIRFSKPFMLSFPLHTKEPCAPLPFYGIMEPLILQAASKFGICFVFCAYSAKNGGRRLDKKRAACYN